MTSVKQEEADTISDISGGQITHAQQAIQVSSSPMQSKLNPKVQRQENPSKAWKNIPRGKSYITLLIPTTLTTAKWYNFL